MTDTTDTMPECAFCGDPIDYCQGHGSAEYAVRVHHDGELVQPVELYDDDTDAHARFDALIIVAESGDTVDVYDQTGYVTASESIA